MAEGSGAVLVSIVVVIHYNRVRGLKQHQFVAL